jgi:hypothetical protein
MANNYDAEQTDPWDYASFYKEASAAFDYEGMYQPAPLEDTIPVSSPLPPCCATPFQKRLLNENPGTV